MTEHNPEVCYVCEFSKDCIKSYGYPHKGCKAKFQTTKVKQARQQAHELIITSAMDIAKQETARAIVERLIKIGNREDETTVGELIDAITNAIIVEYKLDNKNVNRQPS